MQTEGGFLLLLSSAGPSPEIPESEDVYGWLVGSWELDVLHYRATDVSTRGITGEAHFGWILEGARFKMFGSCRAVHIELQILIA
jgi:hypothetical protein